MAGMWIRSLGIGRRGAEEGGTGKGEKGEFESSDLRGGRGAGERGKCKFESSDLRGGKGNGGGGRKADFRVQISAGEWRNRGCGWVR